MDMRSVMFSLGLDRSSVDLESRSMATEVRRNIQHTTIQTTTYDDDNNGVLAPASSDREILGEDHCRKDDTEHGDQELTTVPLMATSLTMVKSKAVKEDKANDGWSAEEPKVVIK